MKEIVIVGGGTAGWMAAISIGTKFPEKKITVIDPEVIGPIGVGESVTGVVLSFVNDYGLSLGEFFRRCDVTFKTGVWFKQWQGPGTEYINPIDSPPDYFATYYSCHVEEFYAMVAASGARLGEVQLYSQLMRANRTDHFRKQDGSVNDLNAKVSCHFNALKFAAWLKEIAVSRKNIRHVDGVIESFEQHPESGEVTKLRTRGARK